MFALDRDLLVLEPALLRDAAWASQRTLDATASVAATTLTLSSGSLTDAGVGPGAVALIDSLPVEVVAVSDATTATVSLLRARRDAPALPPPPATGRPVRVYTFAPQLELVHRAVLAMIGVNPGGEGPLTEAAVTNPGDLVRLECLGALALIYDAADPASAGPLAHAQRAAMYRRRFEDEHARVSVFLDTDGDGVAETRRRLNVASPARG